MVQGHFNSVKLTQKESCAHRLKALLTFRVQQSGDSQFSLCHAEGLLQILLVALSVHLAHVDESGPANRKRNRRVSPHCYCCQS